MKYQTEPFVSIVLPCYNHAEFVGRAIESVLQQGYQNYEFLISDDGSTDDSVSVIRQYKDPRIVFTPIEINTGFSACLYLYSHARGKYIAAISSDDMWKPDFLETSVSFLEQHREYGCSFCIPEFIDKEGRVIVSEDLNEMFQGEGEIRTSEEWFRKLYMEGNCICAPSMCINRDVYEKLAPFRYQYKILQDYEFWLRLLQISNFYVQPDKLVSYRVHPDGENHNIGLMTPITKLLEKTERRYIMLSIMEELDDDFFLRAFADFLTRHPGEEGFCVECEKFSIMLHSKYALPESAILYFYHHYNEERFQTCVEKYYGITRRALWDFASVDWMRDAIAQLRQALKED